MTMHCGEFKDDLDFKYRCHVSALQELEMIKTKRTKCDCYSKIIR